MTGDLSGSARLPDGYRGVDHWSDLDLEVVHRALSEQAYWSLGRPREVTERAFAASRVVGVVDEGGRTAAFARAVTDAATFAWLCDVWVEPDHRGLGLGRFVVERLVHSPHLRHLRRWMLVTDDAHTLYEGFGFTPAPRPEDLMVRSAPEDPQLSEELP